MTTGDDDHEMGDGSGTLGRIALKQVRIARTEADGRGLGATADLPRTPSVAAASRGANPMNRLVPYLDLFARLGDDELSRLARVPESLAANLRQQVNEVNRALRSYIDLLPRLSDDELVRLTGASTKTVRFWRLCQTRDSRPGPVSGVQRETAGPLGAESMATAASARESTATRSAPRAAERATGETDHRVTQQSQSADSGSFTSISGEPFPGFDRSQGRGRDAAEMVGVDAPVDDDDLDMGIFVDESDRTAAGPAAKSDELELTDDEFL